METTTDHAIKASRKGAYRVGLGIFCSRIAGLIRQRTFAHYFGSSEAADAFMAAMKIPNFLQNLFGEGVLSASFIPVYARLLAQGDEKEASRVAGVIASLLAVCTSILVLLGVLATPYMIDVIAPGFSGEKRALTIQLVQIFFPGVGLLVMSAWCLGILNSHRRFFLSYFAPVLWNLAIIATMIIFGGHRAQKDLAWITAWGLVVGSVLQLGVQLPLALKLIKKIYIGFGIRHKNVSTVLQNFVPVVVARGVVQISTYIDNVLASFLPTGAVANLAYAQTLYVLPVSLFGMSVSAASLPIMSGTYGDQEEVSRGLRKQLETGLRQITFFIVPSAIAFLVFGDVIVAALFQTGTFHHDNVVHVWAILVGASVGLLATTMARLYSSTFYALQDTRTPLKCAVVRVILVTALGYLFGLRVPGWLGINALWGAPGLTLSAGLAGWMEFYLLRRYLFLRIGSVPRNLKYLSQLFVSGVAAAFLSWFLKVQLGSLHPILLAALVLTPYGALYLTFTALFGLDEAQAVLRRLRRRY